MFSLLANLITVFRIFLIFILLPLGCLPNKWYFTLVFQIIFVVAIITDYLDGYVARKYKQQTIFGKFFDPIADKLLVIITLLYLYQFRTDLNPIIIKKNIFAVIIMIIIIREFLVTGVRLLASDKGIVVSASFWGKLKTVVTFLAIFCLFFGLYPDKETNFKEFFKFLEHGGDIFLLLSVILTIASGFKYFFNNYKIIRKNFSPE